MLTVFTECSSKKINLEKELFYTSEGITESLKSEQARHGTVKHRQSDVVNKPFSAQCPHHPNQPLSTVSALFQSFLHLAHEAISRQRHKQDLWLYVNWPDELSSKVPLCTGKSLWLDNAGTYLVFYRLQTLEAHRLEETKSTGKLCFWDLFPCRAGHRLLVM